MSSRSAFASHLVVIAGVLLTTISAGLFLAARVPDASGISLALLLAKDSYENQ
jgi:hypothetical protein